MSAALSGAAEQAAPILPETVAPFFAMQGVGKRFGTFDALKDIDIEFRRNEVHCLLGENGAGKSTLCNLIFGIHKPTAGTMMLDGKPFAPSGPRDALGQGVAMVHQHFSLSPELTVIDNLLLGGTLGGLNRKAEAKRIVALAKGYGLSLEPFRRIADLAVGERQRVEIVKCLMRAPRLLILDEPTAVLLPEEIASLIETVRRVAESGCAVVLVTHKLAEIKSVADRVSVLRAGRIAATSDSPASEMGRLVRAMIRRNVGEMDATMMSTLGLEASRSELSVPRAVRVRGKGEAMQANGLSYKDVQGVTRLEDVTFIINKGEIVGIAGVEGNGQTELGLILAGLLHPTAGTWHAGKTELTRASPAAITAAGVGIVPEDRHAVAVANGMTVAENMLNNRISSVARNGIVNRRKMTDEAVSLMERFDVRASGPDARMGSLSGGNQQKAVLARELTTPNLGFLLAAQPTRGLDVGAVEAVYSLIRDACDDGAGVLLISSELEELLAVSDRILVMYRGRILAECPADASQRERIGALMAGHLG